MKTRERILQTSLLLFNEQGEGTVSTNHIADEMDISPGNLYYHFRNKDQIIGELFEQFQGELSHLLDVPDDLTLDLEEVWLFLHLVLEQISAYRFLYDNLTDITRRLRPLRRQFSFLLKAKNQAFQRVCQALRQGGVLNASDPEIHDLSNSLVMVATFWLSYESVSALPARSADRGVGQGAYQVMSLLAPFLPQQHRDHLNALASAYRR